MLHLQGQARESLGREQADRHGHGGAQDNPEAVKCGFPGGTVVAISIEAVKGAVSGKAATLDEKTRIFLLDERRYSAHGSEAEQADL